MTRSSTLLVTGGCGFIGSHVVKAAIGSKRFSKVINLDALSYSGFLINVREVEDDTNYKFIKGSINDSELLRNIIREYSVDRIVHLAAESHVDRSIASVAPFVSTNIDGTRVILEAIVERHREGHQISLLHVSTDEVYGSLGLRDPPFTEDTPVNPRNPYAATKAASDQLVMAFAHTHGINTIITRCSNNYGTYQFPEKLIPLMILNAIARKPLPVYGDGKQIRDWIHVSDHVDALLLLLDVLGTSQIRTGSVYNIGANNERSNIDIVERVVGLTGSDKSLIEFVENRPGHDTRYAMGFRKIGDEFKWKPRVNFDDGLAETVDWYVENVDWVSHVQTEAYDRWVSEQYTVTDVS